MKTLLIFTIVARIFCGVKGRLGKLSIKKIDNIPSHAISFLTEENKVRMTEEEIKQYNQEIRNRTDKLYELDLLTISKEKVQSLIEQYTLPSLPKYDQDKEVTESMLQNLLENRNMNQIQSIASPQKAIVIKRTNLKSFPTLIHCYEKKGEEKLDALQETQLPINTKVLILHESKDQEWVFVLTPIYAGWILKKDIAYAKKQDWSYFTESKQFAVVLEPQLHLGDTFLDMGVRLPYEDNQLILPVKNETGFVEKKAISVSSHQIHIGYLPYTRNHLLIQAFRYEGIPYQWGGMDDGIDCSSYILNLFQTFGFAFPRNVSSQNHSVGKVISVKEKSIQEKKQLLKTYDFALLYQPGHVMLYIGEKEGAPYVLHASYSEGKVVLTNLNTTSHLSQVNKIVLIDSQF